MAVNPDISKKESPPERPNGGATGTEERSHERAILARIIRLGELRCFPAQLAGGVDGRQGRCCGVLPLSTPALC